MPVLKTYPPVSIEPFLLLVSLAITSLFRAKALKLSQEITNSIVVFHSGFCTVTRAPQEEKMLGKNILLVDDEKVIRATYSLLLGEHGYYVVTADCKENALAAFGSHAFDLVITDLIMSGGDGFRLIEEIKDTSPDTPVIAFTGKLSTSVSEYVTLVGADGVIEKSCTNERFIASVKRSLEVGA